MSNPATGDCHEDSGSITPLAARRCAVLEQLKTVTVIDLTADDDKKVSYRH